MDAESIKALAPLLAALIGGIVGWGGAWLTGNIQVRIARETAMRAWRLERVRPVLEKSSEMYGLMVEVGTAARSSTPDISMHAALTRVGNAEVSRLAHIGVRDEQFLQSFTGLRQATEQCLEAAFRLEQQPTDASAREAFDERLDRLNNAIGAMTNAAEDYLRSAR